MRITVFGATGGTGRQVVQQALDAGHSVTAVVRDPARLQSLLSAPNRGEGPDGAPGRRGDLTVLTADVFDPAALAPTVAGADRVVSALGARPTAKTPVRSRGAEAIVAAMRATDTRRLLVVTSAGHLTDAADGVLTRAVVKPLIRTLMPSQLDDYARTDAAVIAGGLDWTIVRPGWLTNGGRRPYRTSLDHGTPGATSISRSDLADFLLTADDSTIGHAVFIGY
jgi:putative NADH-flavin reductase